MENLFSASDIAKLQIPGLPTTRAAVNVKAKRENWAFETTTGVGGTRRLYKLPTQYLRHIAPLDLQGPTAVAGASTAPPVIAGVMGVIAGGSNRVDVRKLELAMHTLNEWESTRGVTVSAERRPAVIAIMYDYLVKADEEGGDGVEVVLRALV